MRRNMRDIQHGEERWKIRKEISEGQKGRKFLGN
jgi:hypothetical protein